MIEPWFCRDGFNLPLNNFIQNKYDLKVFNFYQFNSSGLISLRHEPTGTLYNFTFNFTSNDYSRSKTFKMIPGHYIVNYGIIQFYFELWEHGIIPQNRDIHVYLGYNVIAVTIIIVGIRYLVIGVKLNSKLKKIKY